MCRLFRTKCEKLRNQGSRFIFLILFLSSTIKISTFIFLGKKNQLSSLSTGLHRARKFSEIVQFTTKGLKVINWTHLASKSTFHYRTSLNFYENGCFVWISFVRLFSKLLRCKISCFYHVSERVRLLPILAFVSQLYLSLFFPLPATSSVFTCRSHRVGPSCFTVLELWVIS